MAEDCLFCKIAAGIIPSTQVYADDEFYAFNDINPAAPIHILLIPRKHIPKLTAIQASDTELIGRLLLTANKIAEQAGIAKDGFREVFNCGRHAGQEVDHIHMHILGGRRMTWPPG